MTATSRSIKAHSAEKIGPINVGAGVVDYIYKIFGTYEDNGRKVHATVQVSKDEYQGTVKALLEGLPAVVAVHPAMVYAIQVVNPTQLGPSEREQKAIDSVRQRSVRTT